MIGGGLALLALLVSAGGQDRPAATTTVRGVIVNAGTAAPIAGTRVELVESQRSTQSGADGRFEFSNVPPGKHTLTVSTIGYIFVRRRIDVGDAPFEITVPLAEGTGTYQETVDVTAEPASSRDLGVSSQTVVGSAGLQALRGVATDDPVRALQALPGAATGDDFQAQFSVRGSAFRHTGFVIDSTATPLLFHSVQGVADTGSIAMLNTDVVSRGALVVGPHTERHGDWVGATLEFDMREGSRDRSAIRAAVSGTAASAVLEGPLGPSRRGSWLVSIRRSYIDWLIRKVAPETDGTFGFTDLHNKIVYDLTSRQQLQLVVIAGDATFHEEQTSPANGLQRARSRGGLGLVGWRFVSPSIVVSERVSVAGNQFRDYGQAQQELSRGSSRSIVWRNDATFVLSPAWTIEAGTKAEWQRADQTLRIYTQVGGPLRVRVQQGLADRTHLWSAWSQLAWRMTAGGVAVGARATTNSLYGTHDVSPWALAERAFSRVTLRASAGAAAQLPEIPLFLSNGRPGSMPGEHNSSMDLGVEHRLTERLRWQVTAFARHDRHILRRIGEDRVSNGVRVPASTFPIFGAELDGSPRGVDIVFERRAASGPAGWIGYTFARTTYHDSITSETFPGDFDQRHTINAFVEQRVSYRMDVSAKLRVGSNFPIVGYFSGSPESLQLSSLRNQVRLPTYARLDLRADRTFTFDRGRLTLFVEVMNVLGRQNLRRSDGSITTAGIVSGFVEREIPFVPSAGILIEF